MNWVRAHLAMTLVWGVWVLTVITTMIAVIVGVNFAVDVRDCQRQFNESLIARSELAEQRNALTVRKDDADAAWLSKILAPPSQIAALPPDNPERRAYGLQVTTEWQAELASIDSERDRNDLERMAHPLPSPGCKQ